MNLAFRVLKRTLTTRLGRVLNLKRLGKMAAGAALLSGVIGGFHALAVDINAASQDSLQSIKGVGPTRAKAIVDERDKNGRYQDSEDLSRRVRGIGEKTIHKMKEGGVTFDSEPVKRPSRSRSRSVDKTIEATSTVGAESKTGRRNKSLASD